MTTVKDQKRADAKRLEKQIAKESRNKESSAETRKKFQQSLKSGQPRKNTASEKKGRDASKLKNLAKGLKKESLRNTRLARQGSAMTSRAQAQAQAFSSTLDENLQKSSELDSTLQDAAAGSDTQKADATDHRTKDIKKADQRKEDVLADAKTEAIAGTGSSGAVEDSLSKDDDGQSEGKERQAAAIEEAHRKEVEGSSAPQGAQKIPEVYLKALVKDIYVGVDAQGLSMFHIELKEGVLQGATIQVKADGGKIKLSFQGLDKNGRAMVDSSRGELARGLEKRGLMLDGLTFPS